MLKEIQPIAGYAKYKQAKEAIYQYILSSGVQPGEKVCTEAVLVKMLNISITTVRRALGELVQEGVLVRKVGKGTYLRKRLPGSSVGANRSVLILGYNSWRFLSEDIYYGPIVKVLGASMREADIRQMALIGDWGHDPEAELADIRRHNPGAIVYPYVSEDANPFVLALATLGIPVLLYNNPLEGLAASQVYFDDFQGGADAAAHLIGRGHREMAVIAPPDASLSCNRRVEGFVRAVGRAPGCRIVSRIVAASFRDVDGYRCAEGTLAVGRPDAFFCGSDTLAYGAIKYLEERGLSVPGDVPVMGYGDFQAPSLYHPSLTTIRMDLELMGREIGRWVERVVAAPAEDGRHEIINTCLPVKLIVRDTA